MCERPRALHLSCSELDILKVTSMSEDHVLFGYALPMPRNDLFIALATVAGFLPAIVIVHHLVTFVLRRLQSLGRSVGKQD